jgi:uncharacterized protein (TIGR03083 family)
VRDLATERLDTRTLDLGLPDDASAYADWLAAGAEPLASAFGAADPDAPMWAWGADQHARFWFRRMLHETTVHRADVEIANGRRPKIGADVAADGVDELLENLPTARYFRPRVEELRGEGESIALRTTDSGDAWVIRLAADGFLWERVGVGDAIEAGVSVAAPANALILLAYGRAAAGDSEYEIVGDAKLLARWLECSAL